VNEVKRVVAQGADVQGATTRAPRARPPFTRVGAIVGILLGSIVLTGWWLGLPVLTSGIPGYVTMKPNTAAGMVLAGMALLLLEPEARSSLRTRVGYCLALGCAAIGLLTILAYLDGPMWLRIDQMLVWITGDHGRTTPVARMAATTAIDFVGLGTALLMLDARGRMSRMLGGLALSTAIAIPLAIIVGYLYLIIPVVGSGQGLQMAVHTAAGFLTLGTAIIAARPRIGVARILRSQGPGGVMARRLLPVAVGALVALGLLRLAAETAGAASPAMMAAAATVATMFLLAWLTWRTAVNLDATDEARVAAELTIAQRNAELESANVQLTAAQAFAEAASLAKSEFLSRMSHELRTPLNSIIGFVGVLLRNREARFTHTDLQYLERVKSNGMHLLTLINDILDIARVESGKLTVVLELVPLDGLIGDILLELQGGEAGGGVVIRADVPSGLVPLRTDGLKLKQMIINLVGNAMKFTTVGSVTVRVATWPDGRRAMRLDVIDTGIGIPPDRLEAIFGAFEQADQHTIKRFGGTGLGLSISRAFAAALGYQIVVRSTEGVGSVFSILLDPDAERPRAPTAMGGTP
jgi:signal transduction histidine kinase